MIEPRRREEREGFLLESGTPADSALAGATIRTKGTWLAGNQIIIHKEVGALITSQRYFLGIIFNSVLSPRYSVLMCPSFDIRPARNAFKRVLGRLAI